MLRDEVPQFLQREQRLRELLAELRRHFSARDETRFWDVMGKVEEVVGESLHCICELTTYFQPQCTSAQWTWPPPPEGVEELPAMKEVFAELIDITSQAESDAQFLASLRLRRDYHFLVSEAGTATDLLELRTSLYRSSIDGFREYPRFLERLERARQISRIADPDEILVAMGGRRFE